MRITQGQFSFLPDLTDEEIEKQLAYALDKEYAIMVEYTDDPHPRNYLWEMWKQPAFDLDADEAGEAMKDVHECREAYPNHYIKVVCYDSSLGAQTSKLSFIVNRPKQEPGFVVHRQETHDRTMNYTVHSYSTEAPSGRRYGNEGGLGTDRDPGAVQDATAAQDSPERGKEDGSSNGEIEAASDEGVGES
ncbi:MAG: ribulose bisphosphate carboxylase small subunit [Solirubrobacteraceae bacterium]